jgi:hypothetical protein
VLFLWSARADWAISRVSELMLRICVLGEQLYYCIVQFSRSGEADRPSLQSFDTSPEIEIVPLDSQRPAFTHRVASLRYHSTVRGPAVSMEAAHSMFIQLLDQAMAFLIGPAAIDMSDDSPALSIEPIPSPPRPPF